MFLEHRINIPNNEATTLPQKNIRRKISGQIMAGTLRVNLWRNPQPQLILIPYLYQSL